jgi:membrane protein YdbS with pleckstrin-like domain
MGTTEMVLAVVLGLVVNEMTDLSPWLGRKLVAWSAWLRYQDTPRAGIRAEELAAVINDRPGKLFKLGTGLGFFSAALITRLRRLVSGGSAPGEEPVGDDLLGARPVLPLEDEPTRWVAAFLFPTERFRGEWRRHWIHPAKSLGVITLYAVLGVWAAEERIKPRYVGWVIALVVALAVLTAAHRGFAWYLGRFVITNKRLMSTEGVLFRRVGMIPLLRVTDMRYVQSPLGRLLNYGTFRLESATRSNVLRTIVDLPNPNELYLRLVEELYEPEAVEERLGRHLDEEQDVPDGEPVDLASVRREVILRIGELSTHLAALTDAIARLEPAPASSAPPAGETSELVALPAPAPSGEQQAPPEPEPAALGPGPADEPETVRPVRRRRRRTLADPLPDVGD